MKGGESERLVCTKIVLVVNFVFLYLFFFVLAWMKGGESERLVCTKVVLVWFCNTIYCLPY